MKKGVAERKVPSQAKGNPATKQPLSRRRAIASRAARRPDGADAFVRERADGSSFTRDALAEEMAEGFVGSATSGEDQTLEARDTVMDEEMGGPFVTTRADREFAEGTDPSNPEDAEREPFPTSQGGEATSDLEDDA